MTILSIDHVQIAMPVGQEDQARAFYTGILGLIEIPKPAEVVSGGPVRKALGRAARLIRNEAKANVLKIVAEPNKPGSPPYESTGEPANSIMASRGKMPSDVRGERFIVWTGRRTYRYANTKYNVRKGRVGKEYHMESPTFYGRFLEYGTSRMVPHPWLRPAVEAKGQEAITLATTELVKDLDAIVKKLATARGR